MDLHAPPVQDRETPTQTRALPTSCTGELFLSSSCVLRFGPEGRLNRIDSRTTLEKFASKSEGERALLTHRRLRENELAGRLSPVPLTVLACRHLLVVVRAGRV